MVLRAAFECGCLAGAPRCCSRLRAHRRDPRRGVPISALIVDAGPLYAYVDADDQHHQESLSLLEHHTGPLVVPTLVVTKVAYLIGTRLGAAAEVQFLGDLAAGAFVVETVVAADWLRMAELVATYKDLPLGTVDASTIALSERLRLHTVATFDHRHFTVVRPNNVDALNLLP